MLRRGCRCLASNSILHPQMTSRSVLGQLFQAGQYRAHKEEWTIFSEQLSEEERASSHQANSSKIREWIETMVQNKDSEAVTKIVKYIRESSSNLEGNADALTNYHYHCLFRVFVLHNDRASVQQLISLMEGKKDLINANTVAWSMWYAWRCGNIRAVIDLFSNVACTSRAFLIAPRDGYEELPEGLHCPPLSMLLYILTHFNDEGIVPAELGVLVAGAMSIFGVELSAQDYSCLILGVLEELQSFMRIHRTVLFNSLRSKELREEGHTSYQYFVERMTTSVKQVQATQKTPTVKQLVIRGVVEGLDKCATILEIDRTRIVKVGFVQCRVSTLEGWVRCVLDTAAETMTRENQLGALFDEVVTWAYMQRRFMFVVDLLSQITTRHQRQNFSPLYTTVCQIADSSSNFPTSHIEQILPRYNYLVRAVSEHIPAATQAYVSSQAIQLALNPKEMQDLLQSLLSKKGVSFSVAREAYRCALDACARWVPLDCKLNKVSLQERYSWWLFNDCRDLGLVLYGAVADINIKIRRLFQRGGIPEPVKGLDEMERELDLVQGIAPGTRGTAPSQAYTRRTKSYMNLTPAYVPERMSDHNVFNPYPQIALPHSRIGGTHTETDPFPALFQSMRHLAQSNNPQWYTQDKETAMRIVRCFLHRLDWEHAIQMMTTLVQKVGYSPRSDKELQRVFMEIGDPSGSVAFKLAARILEGEVTAVKDRHSDRKENRNDRGGGAYPQDKAAEAA